MSAWPEVLEPEAEPSRDAFRAALLASDSRWQRAKNTVYRALYPNEQSSKWVDTLIISLIACNVVAVILETEEIDARPYLFYFHVFEWFSSIVFTVEYVLRLWVIDLELDPRTPWRSRFRYLRSFMATVDLIAILPFYLPFFFELDLRFMRAIRLPRLARILKMGRYAGAIKVLAAVLDRKKEELAMSIFILVVMLVMSSSAMYFIEHRPILELLDDGRIIAHQDAADPFRSIPASMWWAVVTLTGVGYGDVVPQSAMGKLGAAIVALLGVGVVAIPTGILAAGFEEIREARQRRPAVGSCPHCGEPLPPPAP